MRANIAGVREVTPADPGYDVIASREDERDGYMAWIQAGKGHPSGGQVFETDVWVLDPADAVGALRVDKGDAGGGVVIRMVDGSLLRVGSVQLAGEVFKPAVAVLRALKVVE